MDAACQNAGGVLGRHGPQEAGLLRPQDGTLEHPVAVQGLGVGELDLADVGVEEDHAEPVGVGQGEGPVGHHHPFEGAKGLRFLRLDPAQGFRQFVEGGAAIGHQHVLLGRKVAVERPGGHAEACCQLAHGERGVSLGLDDASRFRNDTRLRFRELIAAHGWARHPASFQ